MSFILVGWGIEGMRKLQWIDKETGKKRVGGLFTVGEERMVKMRNCLFCDLS